MEPFIYLLQFRIIVCKVYKYIYIADKVTTYLWAYHYSEMAIGSQA